ncbi:uncharacterized protein LODBEIA_P22690 [Lodderomyces beijingensis]|uniref:Altered inheritance of mitochondria protein 24, mitochondrial n=1 Tax=Lodderomyces beijingensis TaxID=1775926 RepID=A0ABP0ZLH7_9ASCO
MMRNGTRCCMQRRSISISHASIPNSLHSIKGKIDPDDIVNLNKTSTDPINIQPVESLASYQSLEFAKLNALGTPPTILSVHLPPSVPIYLRRGSLLSIYGIQSHKSSSSGGLSTTAAASTIRNTLEFPLWWDRFAFNGGKVLGYQKLVSTVPISTLVSSKNNSKSNSEKSFVSLVLDGSTDWAILNKDAIQAYTGNSLSVSMHKFPKRVSRSLARDLKISRKGTGLRSFLHRGYTLLSGRGQVGVVGNGGVYQLELVENEEILIRKSAILGITVNGPFDIENCILENGSFGSNNDLEPKNADKPKQVDVEAETSTQSSPTLVSPSAWEQIVVQTKNFAYWSRVAWARTKALFSTMTAKTNAFLLGNDDFVKVFGPRNLLIQSGTRELRRGVLGRIGESKPRETVVNEKLLVHVEPKTSQGEAAAYTPGDYLSYVTIDPEKGATFQNTPNFKDSIQQGKSS